MSFKGVIVLSSTCNFLNNLFYSFIIFSCSGSSLLHAVCLLFRWGGLLFVAVQRLIAVASLMAAHRLEVYRLQWLQQGSSVVTACGSVDAAHGLWGTVLVVVTHGLSCSAACGIFLNQGLNPCLLLWWVDSYPRSHQGSPTFKILIHWHSIWLCV